MSGTPLVVPVLPKRPAATRSTWSPSVFHTLLVLLLSLVMGVAGAQSGGPAPSSPAPSSSQYKVGAGDVLQVKVYGEASLSGAVPVNETGELDFPLLGPVRVEGLTAPEVAAYLRARLQDGFIRDPQVTVWVDQYGSQPIQVLGAVKAPGVYYISGETTVLELLGKAGGVKGEGVNEVRLTRAGADGQVRVIVYEALVSEGTDNVTVSGGDVLFVPESLVYVSGEVSRPGSVAFRDDLTVARCVAAAGGATSAANLGRVYLLRGDQRIRVNVRKILRGRAEDIVVRAGDQVVVQQSLF